MQRQLTLANPGWLEEHGDVDGAARRRRGARGDQPVRRTRAAPGVAGGSSPHVVFFGENVPKERVERCYAAIDEADALLVAGSSLTVMSGLRFVRYAAKAGLPVVIVNRGVTRGDDLADRQGRGGLQRVAACAARSGGRDEDVVGRLGDDLRSLA